MSQNLRRKRSRSPSPRHRPRDDSRTKENFRTSVHKRRRLDSPERRPDYRSIDRKVDRYRPTLPSNEKPRSPDRRPGSSRRSPERRRPETKKSLQQIKNPRLSLGPLSSVYEYHYAGDISEGAFGVVFKANDKSGSKVAIKKLKPSYLSEDRDGTYLREIDHLKACDHKNIVKLVAVVTNKHSDLFLVFEYCPYDLKKVLAQSVTPFGISVVKSIFVQLLAGLKYLHTKDLCHRDIKPDNLLINAEGIIKIADFGSSKRMKKDACVTPGMVTLRYRAPEIFLGSRTYDTAVDMWSSGCLLAELLLGKPLLDGTSDLEQIDKMCTTLGSPSPTNWPGLQKLPNAKNLVFPQQPVNYLRKLIPNLSEYGHRLLEGLLTYDPALRTTSSQAVEHSFFEEEPLPSRNALEELEIVFDSPLAGVF